jgi:hypothetical protein
MAAVTAGKSGRSSGNSSKSATRQGKSNIAIKRDGLLFAATHLFTPRAGQGVLIKDQGETSAISTDLTFAPVVLD